MIDFDLWFEVHVRFRRGQGKRTMARELGLDRKTRSYFKMRLMHQRVTAITQKA
jgi:hypothetical protein